MHFEARLMWPLGNFLINFLSSSHLSLSTSQTGVPKPWFKMYSKAATLTVLQSKLWSSLRRSIRERCCRCRGRSCLRYCDKTRFTSSLYSSSKLAGMLSRNLALFILFLGAFDAFYLAHPATVFICAAAAAAGWSVWRSLSPSPDSFMI